MPTRAPRHARADSVNRAAEFDMTPMIDVTFQLIVFFLVASDLSRKEITDLDLPVAVACADDTHGDADRVIVNLRPPADAERSPALPTVVVRGRELDLRQLERELAARAAADREPGGASRVGVLVRADRAAPWRHVQQVMQVCASPRVRMHRLQFATTKPAGEERSPAPR